MENLTLGIGDFGVSDTPGTYIKTYALGSCVAVIFYHRDSATAAMAHVALPDSSINRAKAQKKPGNFMDTAVPVLLRELKKKKLRLSPKTLEVALVGGAYVGKKSDLFRIGRRNVESARQLLRKYRLRVGREDVGQSKSRTVTIDISSGKIMVFNPAEGIWEI